MTNATTTLLPRSPLSQQLGLAPAFDAATKRVAA